MSPDQRNLLMAAREAQGYECTVVTGIRKLKPDVERQLLALAPQTDLAEVVVLHWGKPASADRVRAVLVGSAAALVAGWLCLVVVYLRAWKEMRGAGSRAPDATPEGAALESRRLVECALCLRLWDVQSRTLLSHWLFGGRDTAVRRRHLFVCP